MRIKLFIILLLTAVNISAQTNNYPYKRSLSKPNSTWHNIILPDEMYKSASLNFSDLRIFGFKDADTIEVPYLLKQNTDRITNSSIDFKMINPSHNSLGYYYTFETGSKNIINQINLNFNQKNFDWKVNLEGSSNNNEWFTILSDYRILSIKNNDTDYSFSSLNFPESQYRYYRILIKSNEQPELLTSKIFKIDTLKGQYRTINTYNLNINNDKKNKETVIDITLKTPLPLSYLKINTAKNFDYYRSLKIECVTDSFKTENGMQYNYKELYNGSISSLEKNIYNFANTISNKLKISIQNNDNPALHISNVELKGNPIEIVARFDQLDYSYAIYYGNNSALAPNYEIAQFEHNIPNNLSNLQIGQAEKNPAYSLKESKPLFENKIWLWALMALIIVVLATFSFKMLKN